MWTVSSLRSAFATALLDMTVKGYAKSEVGLPKSHDEKGEGKGKGRADGGEDGPAPHVEEEVDEEGKVLWKKMDFVATDLNRLHADFEAASDIVACSKELLRRYCDKFCLEVPTTDCESGC